MCDFLSFFIHKDAAGLPKRDRYLFGDMVSHSDTMKVAGKDYSSKSNLWRDAEWTADNDDSLTVRGDGADALREIILNDFVERINAVNWGCKYSVGGWLYLGGLTGDGSKLKLPQTVGGWLDLSGLTGDGSKLKLPQTVGGGLYLSGLTIKPEIKK